MIAVNVNFDTQLSLSHCTHFVSYRIDIVHTATNKHIFSIALSNCMYIDGANSVLMCQINVENEIVHIWFFICIETIQIARQSTHEKFVGFIFISIFFVVVVHRCWFSHGNDFVESFKWLTAIVYILFEIQCEMFVRTNDEKCTVRLLCVQKFLLVGATAHCKLGIL